MLSAIWMRLQKSAQVTVGWPRPSSAMARKAFLLTMCSKALWKRPRVRAITQPKGTMISQTGQKKLDTVYQLRDASRVVYLWMRALRVSEARLPCPGSAMSS